MKYTKHAVTFAVLLTTIFIFVSGYPITNTDESLINKDEKRFPNGTVMGKYSYTDNEGNPIHVRYYADDASYGVELKSVKIVNSEPIETEKLSKYPLQITEHPFEAAMDPFTGFKDLLRFNKTLTHEPLHGFKDKAKANHKNKVEFEILLQNELKVPEKCGKEKVKVYFDKDKRKTRNAPFHYESENYCNRF